MTKLEKHIILAINNQESNDSVLCKRGAFYTQAKGILQNFAVMNRGYLMLRLDQNCKGICKKVLKNKNDIDYKICLGGDQISGLIFRDFSKEDARQNLIDSFFLYDHHLMELFVKNGISFEELISNFVEAYDIEEEYEEILSDDSFWGRIHGDRMPYVGIGWNRLPMKDIEKSELDKDVWWSKFKSEKRNRLIDDLLS